MKRTTTTLPLAILAGILIIGAIILACIGRPIPDYIVLCTTALLGAVAGVALPTGAGTVEDVANLAGQLATPPAAAAAPVPAPLPAPTVTPPALAPVPITVTNTSSTPPASGMAQ